jgi:hypothetical protein
MELQREVPGLFLDCGNVKSTPGHEDPLVHCLGAELPPAACSADGTMPWLNQVERSSSQPTLRPHYLHLPRLRLHQVSQRLLPFSLLVVTCMGSDACCKGALVDVAMRKGMSEVLREDDQRVKELRAGRVLSGFNEPHSRCMPTS